MSTGSQLKLGVADHGLRVSSEDFAAATFDEPWRYELVKGKLLVMSPNGEEHVAAYEPFRDAFVAYKLAHRERVHRVVSEAWISIDDDTQRIADLAVYLKRPGARVTVPRSTPDLVLETVSGGGEDRKRDYVDKRAEYLRIGVKEYLIVDPFQHRVTVLRRGRGRFVESNLGPEDTYSTPLLPGLKLVLHGII